MSQFSKVVLQPEMVARDTGPRANSRLSVIYSLEGRRKEKEEDANSFQTDGDNWR